MGASGGPHSCFFLQKIQAIYKKLIGRIRNLCRDSVLRCICRPKIHVSLKELPKHRISGGKMSQRYSISITMRCLLDIVPMSTLGRQYVGFCNARSKRYDIVCPSSKPEKNFMPRPGFEPWTILFAVRRSTTVPHAFLSYVKKKKVYFL